MGRIEEKIADYGSGKINQKTEYDYDELGRLETITGYADGSTAQTTTYTYDSLGRIINVLYPDGNDIDFVYNAAGKVISRTDQRGIVTTYDYDGTYNLLAKMVDGNSVTDNAEETFTYDGLGRMLTASKTISSTTVSQIEFAYNNLGTITDANETLFGGTKRETHNTYNQAGYLASITYPDGTSVEITPDAVGRIDTLKVSSTTIAAYKYTGPLVAERKYPALATDVVYRPNYDNLGRITVGNTYQGGVDILKFAYDYEPNTYNISRIKFDHRPADPCNEFSYDNLERLTMAEYGVDETNESFTMDDLGNRDSVMLKGGSNEDYVIDNITNRYTSVGGDNLEYDKVGNLTKDKDGFQYEYDYENRITRIKKNGSTTVAQFAYDALGRRIRKTDSIADTNTLYYSGSGWQVLAEYNGSSKGSELAVGIAVDNSQNVYVTGSSYGDTTYNDYATVKYDPNGSQLWVKRYNDLENGNDGATCLAIDGSGNVYIAGYSYGGSSGTDYVTIKYSPDGNQLWVVRYNGPENSDEEECDLANDGSGNVYVTGVSFNQNTISDYVTVKYDTNGNRLWTAVYNDADNGDDIAYALKVDNSGNVYVTGASFSNNTDYDYVTIKYGPGGNQLWPARYNSPQDGNDGATCLAIDGSGNVYVTGYGYGGDTNYDYATIKYDTNGNQLWLARYNGPENSDDYVSALTLDVSGSVYVTGFCFGSSSIADYITVKYDRNGNQVWWACYNGIGNSEDYTTALTVDNSGNVFVTGQSMGVDTNYDYATIKYIQRDYCTSPIAGDLNNDCKVDFKDIAIPASHWLDCNYALDEQCR